MFRFPLFFIAIFLLNACSPKTATTIQDEYQNISEVPDEAEMIDVIDEPSEVAPADHQTLNTQGFSKEKKDALDAYFTLLEKHDKMMGAFSFSQDGKMIYERYLGKADVTSDSNIDAESKFRIGSISKTFTTVLIFQLIEAGKLNLDDKLSKFFPSVPQSEKISISNLLNHRSGIFNFTDAPSYMMTNTKPTTREKSLKQIISFERAFPVDSKADYSNSNYLLLSWIIEDLYSKSYAEVLNEKIVKVIALNHTKYGGKIDLKNNEVNSYYMDDGDWTLAPETDMSVPLGAGAIISTVNDLNHFFNQLFKGNLINESSLASMSEMIDGYGRGLFQIPFNEHVALGHNGGIDGFSSNAFHFKELGLGGSITVNGNNHNMNDVLVAALSIYFDKTFELPRFDQTEIKLNTEEIKKYKGTFASVMMPLKITLFEEDGKLKAQATGQGSFPLTPFEDGIFKFEQAGIVMKFEQTTEGGIDYNKFELRQGGGSFPFKKE